MADKYYFIEDDSGEYDSLEGFTKSETENSDQKATTNKDGGNNKKYYVRKPRSNKKLGPYSGKELLSEISGGNINNNDLIRRDTSQNWHFVHEIPELAKAIRRFTRLEKKETESNEEVYSEEELGFATDSGTTPHTKEVACRKDGVSPKTQLQFIIRKRSGIIAISVLALIGAVYGLLEYGEYTKQRNIARGLITERDERYSELVQTLKSGSIENVMESLELLSKNTLAVSDESDWQNKLRDIEGVVENKILDVVHEELGIDYKYALSIQSGQHVDAMRLCSGYEKVLSVNSRLSKLFALFEKLNLHRVQLYNTQKELSENILKIQESARSTLVEYIKKIGSSIVQNAVSKDYDFDYAVSRSNNIPTQMEDGGYRTLSGWALQHDIEILGNITPSLATGITNNLQDFCNFTVATKFVVENIGPEHLKNIDEEITVGGLLSEGVWRTALTNELINLFARIHSLTPDYNPHSPGVWVEGVNEATVLHKQVKSVEPQLRKLLPSQTGTKTYLVIVGIAEPEQFGGIKEFLAPYVQTRKLYGELSKVARRSDNDSYILSSPEKLLMQIQQIADTIEKFWPEDTVQPKIFIDWDIHEIHIENDRELTAGIPIAVVVDQNNQHVAWVPINEIVLKGATGWAIIDKHKLATITNLGKSIYRDTKKLFQDYSIKWRDETRALYLEAQRIYIAGALKLSDVTETKLLYEAVQEQADRASLLSLAVLVSGTPWDLVTERLSPILKIYKETQNTLPVININDWVKKQYKPPLSEENLNQNTP
jgi:hypothetical protein